MLRALATSLLAALLWPHAAAAHMPLLRELAVADRGAQRVGRMPGFGFHVEQGGAPRYACDALLGIVSGEEDVPWVMLPGGRLLAGTRQGLRALSPEGCPVEVGVGLPAGAVSALALAEPDRVYAVVDGQPLTLHVSSDSGATFRPLSELPSPLSVSGLALGSTSDRLVALQVSTTMATLVSWSDDAGATWDSHRYGGTLTPLTVLGDGALLARRTLAGQRGVQIVRLASPGAEASEVLDLNYFGGFAHDPEGASLWLGDEGGGLYQSIDDGLNFMQVDAKRAPACLVHDEGQLWACFAGLPEQVAVAYLSEGQFVDAGRLADVTDLVRCEDVDVEQVCAAAWQEWQVDVLLAAGEPLGEADAGVPKPPVEIDAGPLDATPVDAGRVAADASVTAPDAALPGGPSPAAGGCHVARPAADAAHPLALFLGLLAPFFVLARTRLRDGLTCLSMDGSKAAPGQEDAALVARAQAGDGDAFMALFDRHAPIMLALGRRILGDESQAEDLLQDVFLEAWRAVRGYDPQRATVRTWLLVRMRSRALDRLDRRAVELRARQLLQRSETESGLPADATLAVRQGLAGLDGDVRAVLELSYYLGMTAPEIAAHLAIPEGTVRSRLARGFRALAQRLDREGPDDEGE